MNKYLTLLGFSVIPLAVVSGCSSAPKAPKPTGDMIAVNQSIPTEIANSIHPVQPVKTTPVINKTKNVEVGGIDEFDALAALEKDTKTGKSTVLGGNAASKKTTDKCFACEKTVGGVVVAPAKAEQQKPIVKPKLSVGVNESAFIAVSRWARSKNFDGIVFNTSDALRERFERKNNGAFYADTTEESLRLLAAEFTKENPKLNFWFAFDSVNKKLIIHDIGDRVDVHMFTVQQGSLKKNAFALAADLGWKVTAVSWPASTPDYNEMAGYKLVVSGDAIRSFRDLLKGYNIQAQLDLSTNTAYFTPLNK